MNDEERRRTMDFMLQQQAKFDAHIAELRESDKRADTRLTRLENILRGAIRTGLRERREWRESYAALVDAHIRTEDVVRGLGAATQRNTEDLNRLAKIVERTSTERNGGKGGDGQDVEDGN